MCGLNSHCSRQVVGVGVFKHDNEFHKIRWTLASWCIVELDSRKALLHGASQVYYTTLSLARTIQRGMVEWLVHDKLDVMYRAAVGNICRQNLDNWWKDCWTPDRHFGCKNIHAIWDVTMRRTVTATDVSNRIVLSHGRGNSSRPHYLDSDCEDKETTVVRNVGD